MIKDHFKMIIEIPIRFIFYGSMATVGLQLAIHRGGGVPSGRANCHGLLTLFTKFLASCSQLLFSKVVHTQSLNNAPFFVCDLYRETKHDALGGTVTTIREDTHAYKFA